jgi:hypothetical protein
MSWSATWIAAVCATALFAAGAQRSDARDESGATKSTDGGGTCPAYWVIGVTGSGEHPKGEHEEESKLEIPRMGDTVAVYVTRAAALLPANEAKYLALPYPAVPVGPHYPSSVDAGQKMLAELIRTRASVCPDIRIGIVGYSQGADVVHQALQTLESSAPASLDKVRAVLLIADPHTDPTARYHFAITLSGERASDRQRGNLLGALPLPHAIQDRAASLCISGDLVCDATQVVQHVDLLNMSKVAIEAIKFHSHSSVHTDGYKHCCSKVSYIHILGDSLANRLLQPPAGQPPDKSPPGRVHPI